MENEDVLLVTVFQSVYAPLCFTLSETLGVQTLVILMGSMISIILPPANKAVGR